MIELHGAYRFADSLRLQLYYRFRRTWPLVIAAFFISCVALALLAAGPRREFLFMLCLFAILFGLWLALNVVLMFWTACRQLGVKGCLKETVSLAFSADGIECRRGSGDRTKVNWTDLHTINETKTFFLLHMGPGVAIVPKRFFMSDEQMDLWKRVAATGIAPTKIVTRGFARILC